MARIRPNERYSTRHRWQTKPFDINALRSEYQIGAPTGGAPVTPSSGPSVVYPEAVGKSSSVAEDNPGFFSRVINFLSSGAFAVGGAIEGYKDVLRGDVDSLGSLAESASKPLVGLGRGLRGRAGIWPSESLGPEVTKYFADPVGASFQDAGLFDTKEINPETGKVETTPGKSSPQFVGDLVADIALDPFVYPAAIKGVARGVGKGVGAIAPQSAKNAAARARDAAKGKFTPRAKKEAAETLDRTPSVAESLAKDPDIAIEPLAKSDVNFAPTPDSSVPTPAAFANRLPDESMIPHVMPRADNIREGLPQFARATVNTAKGTIHPFFPSDLHLQRNVRQYSNLDELGVPFREATPAPVEPQPGSVIDEVLGEAVESPKAFKPKPIKISNDGFRDWGQSNGGTTIREGLDELEKTGKITISSNGITADASLPRSVHDMLDSVGRTGGERIFGRLSQTGSSFGRFALNVVKNKLGINATPDDYLRLVRSMREHSTKPVFKSI